MMNDTHAEPEFRNVTVIGGAELVEQRDDAEIRLMRALDEIPLPQ
jgi:hypothetical protein